MNAESVRAAPDHHEGRALTRVHQRRAGDTRTILTELARTLIDIHSQNEHQSLLRRDVQLDLLDHYAGLEELAAQVRDCVSRTGAPPPSDCRRSKSDAEQSRDRRTLLEYQLGELVELAVAPGEYEDVLERFRRLSKGQDIAQRVGAALAVLSGESEPENPVSTTSAGSRRCSAASTMRTRRSPRARELLETALTHLDETAHELRRYLEDLTVRAGRTGNARSAPRTT